jgi:transposase InsO family protein
VAGLCSVQQIWSVFTKKRGLSRKSGPPVHDDLVRRQFTAHAPDRVWLTDITEHSRAEGKLYLCAIKEACSGRIAGYSVDGRMKASLAVAIGTSPVPSPGQRPSGRSPREITHWDTGRAAVPGRDGGRLALTTTKRQPAGLRIMRLV